MFSFLKKPTPEEMVKKWKRELRKEDRGLDAQIRAIDLQEKKTIRMVKERVKAGDQKSAKTLAKEIAAARKAKERIYTAKAQMNSVSMQLQQNLSMAKVAGHLAKSTEVMKMMNNLIKLPELNKVMMAMGQEMMKAGIIEEMISDAFGSQDELEAEAEQEVDKILDEIMITGPKVSEESLETTTTTTEEQPVKEDDEIFNRLRALKTG
ncbi:SNF7 family protein [Heterostelium album PN500]|uniref:SNF7 family protein n=1 Tax=Heterostelium pallidum (strain ATCC 26659 / Pp 5 / PN500) TaxID=670386 RepID=D3BHH6_HETP5|nr:SNF7 family protein [Heterostelium album PN500]EFA79153.1 SNF7 family protein [Heterostelium album PN500]|eukprot:XP_020431275.1 SNF7 family protein [Heterostelium album PN500]